MTLSHACAALTLACCVLPSAAMAQATDAASGWYIGGSVGSSSIKLQTENIVANGQQDTRDTGYKLVGGYKFNANWAAEFQYFDLGTYRYSEVAPATGVATVKTNGMAISGVGLWPVSEQVSLLGKIGLAQQKFSAQATSGGAGRHSGKATRSTTLLGVGAEYHINKTLRVRAEYEYFGVPTVLTSGNQKLKLRTDLISVGLLYQF